MSADDGFDAYFDRMYPAARSVALRILGSVTESEDVAAEAFVKAFVRWRRVQDLPHRDAWVLRVTANAAIDVTRRRPDLPSLTRPGSELDDDSVTRIGLVSALASLPRRQCEAVVLRHLVGLPVTEVAGALGVSDNTVKRHLQRGISGLRLLLDPPGADDR